MVVPAWQLVSHALLGNQQDGCADKHQATEDVEQGGTHTTGGGQLLTGLVHDGGLKFVGILLELLGAGDIDLEGREQRSIPSAS